MMTRYRLLAACLCFISSSAYAAQVGVVWRNDTGSTAVSFNDTFGHQVSVGTYNSGTGVWSPTGNGSLATLAVSGNATISGTLGVTGLTTLGAATVTGTFTAGPDVSFFPGATNNVSGTGIPGANFTLAPCWASNTCGLMIYSTPAVVAQNIIPLLRVQRLATYSGGSSTNVASGIWMLDTTSAEGVNDQWAILAEQHNKTRTSGFPGGQNVALAGAHFKDIESATVTITNASPAVVTWTASNFVAGDQIYFKTSGTLPSPLATATNYYVISAGLGANSFEISTTLNGSPINTTTNGSGTHTGLAEKSSGWGSNLYAQDNTGIINPTSASLGLEADSYVVAGAGTDTNNQRIPLYIAGGVFPGSDAAVHIGSGITMATVGGATIDVGIRFAQIAATPIYGTLISSGTATATTGIDFSGGTITNAIILAAGQSISLEAGNTHKFSHVTGPNHLSYDVSGVYTFQIFDTGVARIGQNTANPTGFSGGIYYNSTTNEFRSYDGTSWAIIPKSPVFLASNSAPTISAGFGTSPSITANNGTWAFRVNVGTGGTASSGTVGMPTAPTGWNCDCSDVSTTSSTVFMTKETGSTTTTVVIGNFNTSGTNVAWGSGDVIAMSCRAF